MPGGAEPLPAQPSYSPPDLPAGDRPRLSVWHPPAESPPRDLLEPSADQMAQMLRAADHPAAHVAEMLQDICEQDDLDRTAGSLRSLMPPRWLHSLGSAVAQFAENADVPLADLLPGLCDAIAPNVVSWLEAEGLRPAADATVGEWTERLKAAAFDYLGRAIVHSGTAPATMPENHLRGDEIVWGRAPARLDLGGGWTDTPPYALEFGGGVLNAAVDLNGQAPIQAFARVVEDPLIRITSIDRGTRLEIREFEELLNYRELGNEFSLSKAALALTGFAPQSSGGASAASLRQVLEAFGGGLELSTLAAIPKGSGLGTSSIMGAVTLAVLDRVMGRPLDTGSLFHRVLQLEQVMTTGGGWQDQVGGVIDGVKLISAPPGMVPRTTIEFVSDDVLDPGRNGGCTLLYYTGITRLAKNILGQVVARYLDRQPAAMATLQDLRAMAPAAATAMARRDLAQFGCAVDAVWQLNKQLDPGCTNRQIDELFARARPHIHGAKLLGAGGGGFLLLIARSPEDAARLRAELEADPPNPLARFFQFSINREGLKVTVC